MKRAKIKRILSLMTVGVLLLPMMPVTVNAEETITNGVYEETNAYVLNSQGAYGPYYFEYSSPYNAEVHYTHVNRTNAEWIAMVNLYNIDNTNQYSATYCVDQYTSVVDNSFYKRMNLEDSDFYSEETAGLLRSIMMKGFPNVGLEDLEEAAGVESLTPGEAINATQLAIWQAAYGDQMIIEDFMGPIYEWWYERWWYGPEGSKTHYKDLCHAEIENGYGVEKNRDIISANIEAVFNYLMSLEPTVPNEVAVSATSFVEWSDEPVKVEDGEGIYDITLSATVNVVEKEEDDLKLTAVLGDYFTTVDLENGIQTVEITIQDVPAVFAEGEITLAIDGKQTVADVFMFEVEGGREAAQRRIGYAGIQLPVHAEVILEPERIVTFEKKAKVTVMDDAEGKPIYQYYPLEGIVFDLFFVADFDQYVNGEIILPDEPVVEGPVFGVDKKGNEIILDYNYPAYTVTTDDEGKAEVNLTKSGLVDGVYIVREREHAAIETPVEPFYIMLPYTNDTGDGWNYELHIIPKNIVKQGPEIKKDVIEIEHEDKSDDEEQRVSVPVNEEFTWIIRSEIPVDLAEAKFYEITDDLDSRLTYTDKLTVKVEDIAENASYNIDTEEDDTDVDTSNNDVKTDNILTEDVHYTVDAPDDKDNKLVITLTAAGMDKVAEIAGEKYVEKEIRVYFNTVVNESVTDSMGKNIENQATLKYTNSVNFNYNAESDLPRVYTCGINIYKHDAKLEVTDPEDPLAGAVFQLVKKVDAATVGAQPLITKEEGLVYVIEESFFTAVDATTGELTGKNTVVTTDGAGAAMFYGLAEGEYYLIEKKAPEGYNLLSYPVKVTLDEGSHLDGNKVEVANSNRFRLPETGGMGTAAFTGSGMVMLAAAAILGLRKKKRKKRKSDKGVKCK